jgi:heme/copper-type cytochrome/quinol oxidase subunit 2
MQVESNRKPVQMGVPLTREKIKCLAKNISKELMRVQIIPLGQLWEDSTNKDDIYITQEDLHLVVNKPVRLIINAKDVIHDVGLSHFRLKMDAVPGTPTTMWFTPTKTTKQMRSIPATRISFMKFHATRCADKDTIK